MTEKVWVRTCYPNDLPIAMGTGAGTHARHKGIQGSTGFILPLALHSCAITLATLMLHNPLTFTLWRHTQSCTNELLLAHTHTKQTLATFPLSSQAGPGLQHANSPSPHFTCSKTNSCSCCWADSPVVLPLWHSHNVVSWWSCYIPFL